MMDEHGRIDALIARWEESGAMSPEDFRFLEAHIAACVRCQTPLGGLLPLIRVDSGGAAICEADDDLPGGVMEAIGREGRMPATVRAPSPRPLLIIPLMAAAVLAALFLVPWFASAGRGPDTGTVTLRFVISAPDARSVALAGDFTGWRTEGYELRRSEDPGTWEISLPLRRGRSYSYNFVIDSVTWIIDPAAPETVEDGFGGESTLLRL